MYLGRVLNLEIYLTRTPQFRIRIRFNLYRGVKRFRRDVGAVWPANRRAVDEECFKVNFALQRSEYWASEPRFKVDHFLRAITKLNFDYVPSHIFCFCN